MVVKYSFILKSMILIASLLTLLLWYRFVVSYSYSDFANFSGLRKNRAIDAPIISAVDLNTSKTLESLLNCKNRDYDSEVIHSEKLWVLKNYVTAEHGGIKCFDTITYTTHSDFTFLDNVPQLVERWQAPISIAIYAPGDDFEHTIQSIQYLRQCVPESHQIRTFVTFHIYFDDEHSPEVVPKYDETSALAPFFCLREPPCKTVKGSETFRSKKGLLYPINIGRNIARNSALTHFILPSDIELYPNPGLPKDFLMMIARNGIEKDKPGVYPIAIFEVRKDVSVPRTKSELKELLKREKAYIFHKRICAACHTIPEYNKWLELEETKELNVFHVGKRQKDQKIWEPIFIGTHDDPYYEERLSWEGKRDKMTQGYVMCVLGYEFRILNNAFLVHRPGIKKPSKDRKRVLEALKTDRLIANEIYPELEKQYGHKEGCNV